MTKETIDTNCTKPDPYDKWDKSQAPTEQMKETQEQLDERKKAIDDNLRLASKSVFMTKETIEAVDITSNK